MFIMFPQKKHFYRYTVVLFTLFLSVPVLQAAEYVHVIKDNVNVRTGPSTDNPVYMELFKGYPLKVVATKADWYKIVDYENDSGWIHRSLVVPNDKVIVDVKNSVRMRKNPSTAAGSTVIANVERGVVLTRLAKQGSWTKVEHSGGTTGWIFNDMLWPK